MIMGPNGNSRSGLSILGLQESEDQQNYRKNSASSHRFTAGTGMRTGACIRTVWLRHAYQLARDSRLHCGAIPPGIISKPGFQTLLFRSAYELKSSGIRVSRQYSPRQPLARKSHEPKHSRDFRAIEPLRKRLRRKLDLKGRKCGVGWRRRTTSTRTNLWLRPACEAGSSEICPISANLSAK